MVPPSIHYIFHYSELIYEISHLQNTLELA
jgi:hypothetical protein